jgi:putative ABC transport system ATP-binding protein
MQMLDLLASLNAAGTTVLYVTHDADLARRAHRRVTIRDGLVEAE